MILPLQISCRNPSLLRSIETAVEERANHLVNAFRNIIRCHVEIRPSEIASANNKAPLIVVHIQVPGRQFSVKYTLEVDPLTAIKNVFRAAQRLLQKHYQQLHSKPIATIEPPARITTLDLENGSGYITSSSGQSYYFDKSHVMNNGYKTLQLGEPVRFFVCHDSPDPRLTFLAPL